MTLYTTKKKKYQENLSGMKANSEKLWIHEDRDGGNSMSIMIATDIATIQRGGIDP